MCLATRGGFRNRPGHVLHAWDLTESAPCDRALYTVRAVPRSQPRVAVADALSHLIPPRRVFFPSSSKVALPKAVKPALMAAVTNALLVAPSMAGEPGKIFDFNLTLPIIATEFLLLMVILDKTIFGPVGKALDDRDQLIRDQLAAVGDNSSAVADLIVSTSYFPLAKSTSSGRTLASKRAWAAASGARRTRSKSGRRPHERGVDRVSGVRCSFFGTCTRVLRPRA